MLWKFLGVAVYMIILLVIGAAASRRMKSIEDYYAGGKNLSYWAVAFSARATGESAWLLLGLTGMGATVGIRGMWVVLGEVLGVVGAWLFMAYRFNRLTTRYNSMTVPDYLESRFRDGSRRIRIVSAMALAVFVTIYVSAQIDATGTAFETFLGIDYFLGALLGFAVVMAYATSGGFVAVVWSDIFQGALMFVGLVALPVVGLVQLGGWGEVSARLTAIDPSLLAWGGAEGWTSLVIAETLGLALIGLGFLGSPQIFVRFLALRSPDEVPKGSAVAFIWTLLADAGAVLVGMVGRAWLTTPGQAVEGVLGNGGQDVLPMLVDAVMPPVLIGLYIAIVLSAIMSTVDSLLVVASSAVVRDLYQQVWHPEIQDDELVGMSRIATFVIAFIALAISMTIALTVEGRTIFWFVIFGWSGIAATFCPVMILSLYWSRMTARGALAAMVTGFLAVPLFKFGGPSVPMLGPYLVNLTELPPAFLASFFAGVLVSATDMDGQIRMSGAERELEEAAS